jgi:signal transduction histidine kinase
MTGDFAAEVQHQGETLGALTVTMPANDQLDPGREKLVRDLAAQAGLVLRNVRLIEELKASRQRLVTAQDEERRKLERNIHDGVQQQLVALAINLRLARQLTERDLAKANELLERSGREVTETLEDLRDLARGIYPPLLAAQGLAEALTAQAAKAALPVEIVSNGLSRYAQEVEAAIYFCCLEALQNVAKYSHATHATVRLSEEDGHLAFEVQDDGKGFDASNQSLGTGLQGMSDRLSAQDGMLEIRSRPGEGPR